MPGSLENPNLPREQPAAPALRLPVHRGLGACRLSHGPVRGWRGAVRDGLPPGILSLPFQRKRISLPHQISLPLGKWGLKGGGVHVNLI